MSQPRQKEGNVRRDCSGAPGLALSWGAAGAGSLPGLACWGNYALSALSAPGTEGRLPAVFLRLGLLLLLHFTVPLLQLSQGVELEPLLGRQTHRGERAPLGRHGGGGGGGGLGGGRGRAGGPGVVADWRTPLLTAGAVQPTSLHVTVSGRQSLRLLRFPLVLLPGVSAARHRALNRLHLNLDTVLTGVGGRLLVLLNIPIHGGHPAT